LENIRIKFLCAEAFVVYDNFITHAVQLLCTCCLDGLLNSVICCFV